MAGDDSEDGKTYRLPMPATAAPNPSLQPIVENFGRHGWIEAAEFEDWLTPPEALHSLVSFFDQEVVVNALLRRLGLGLIQGAAEVTTLSSQDGQQQESHGFVPPVFWTLSTAPGWKDAFWKTGDLWFPTGGGYAITTKDWIEFTGVRFDPAGIAKAARALGRAPQAPKTANEPPLAAGARRGAKRKMWWDDLWIEMIRRIRAGTLNPKDKAALQTILETYVMHDLNGEYGDSTLKPMASKLFDYLEEIRGK